MNDLAAHIQAARLIDTHEHLRDERTFIEHGPDVLQDLFDNYARFTRCPQTRCSPSVATPRGPQPRSRPAITNLYATRL